MNDFKCKQCGNSDYQISNRQKLFQKELKNGHLILLTIFAIISIIGIIIIIKNTIAMMTINSSTYYKDELTALKEYMLDLMEYEKYKANLYLGIALLLIGGFGAIFTHIFYSMDPKYKIEYETKRICTNCGKPHKIPLKENIDNPKS